MVVGRRPSAHRVDDQTTTHQPHPYRSMKIEPHTWYLVLLAPGSLPASTSTINWCRPPVGERSAFLIMPVSVRFLLLLLLISTSIAADHDSGLRPPPDGTKFCTYTGDDTYQCSQDPLTTIGVTHVEHNGEWNYQDDRVSIGVPQRIDGTEAERLAITKVLQLSQIYFYDEVLSMPEYKDVRSRCNNRNELCAFWAAVGECETNRVFMLPNCPLACRLCLLKYTHLRV